MGSLDMKNNSLFSLILLDWAILNLQVKSNVCNPKITNTHQSDRCLPLQGEKEAEDFPLGSKCATLVILTHKALEIITVLGVLRAQNEYFLTITTIYHNLQEVYGFYSKLCIKTFNLGAQTTRSQNR